MRSLRGTGSRRVRNAVLVIATSSALLVGCSSGGGTTSVRAGQQSASGQMPTTTAPSVNEDPVGTVLPIQDDPNVPVPSTIVEPPRNSAGPPPVPTIEPIEAQLVNDNVRDGGLGTLCWARWEINRQIRIGASSVDRAEAEGAIRTLREELPSIDDELGRVVSELPPELVPFVTRLRADIGAADSLLRKDGNAEMLAKELANQFDFDSYPAVDQYRRLAAEHSACKHL